MSKWQSRIVGTGTEDPLQLVANPRNWRIHPKGQQKALASVLDEVGWVQQVLVNKTTGNVVDGHLRVELAISKNEAEVPVLYVELTEQEEGLILASLDPIGSMAAADEDKMRELLAETAVADDELRALLEDLGGVKPEGLTDADDVPEEPEDVYVKPGDLWLLGEHRLLCGDSTSEKDTARLGKAEAVFTSPPYLQQRDYNKNMAADWDILMSGVFTAMNVEPSAQVFVNLGPVHRDGRVVRYWDTWLDIMEQEGWPLFGWYVWDKLNGMPGDWNGRLAPAHEFIFHFAVEHMKPRKTVKSKGTTSKASKHTQRMVDGSMKGFYSTDKIGQSHKVPDSVIRLTPQQGGIEGHPAPFPVALPSTFIEAYAAETWLDPFAGSGTTIIAAEQAGRRCYAMDIEPKYVQVAKERWEAFTGKEATRGDPED